MRGKITDDIGPAKSRRIHRFVGETGSTIACIAQVILAHIAECTTVDFPWLSRADAVAAPGLLSVPASARHEALNALEQELAIETEKNPPRVRIRVPLTAAALREDGPALRARRCTPPGTVEFKTMSVVDFQSRGRGQQELAEHIVAELVHPEFPQSWNLAIPPEFGEAAFLGQLASLLRSHPRRPLVAVVQWDRVPSVEEVVREMHRQWSESANLPPLKEQRSASKLLEALFVLLPKDRCAVQVFGRFHKVIERVTIGGIPECSGTRRRSTSCGYIFGHSGYSGRVEDSVEGRRSRLLFGVTTGTRMPSRSWKCEPRRRSWKLLKRMVFRGRQRSFFWT